VADWIIEGAPVVVLRHVRSRTEIVAATTIGKVAKQSFLVGDRRFRLNTLESQRTNGGMWNDSRYTVVRPDDPKLDVIRREQTYRAARVSASSAADELTRYDGIDDRDKVAAAIKALTKWQGMMA
jgi:hypothetical protein